MKCAIEMAKAINEKIEAERLERERRRQEQIAEYMKEFFANLGKLTNMLKKNFWKIMEVQNFLLTANIGEEKKIFISLPKKLIAVALFPIGVTTL